MRRYLADLFSGKGRVSAAARRMGFAAREWDVRNGVTGDLGRRKVLARLRHDILSGAVLAAVLAPPCQSFSIANNSSGPIRSKERPRGLANLPQYKRDKVERGNKLLDVTIKVIKWLTAARVPFALEQPL